MSSGRGLRPAAAYGIVAAALALLSLAAAGGIAAWAGGATRWVALGWALMSSVGVAGGCWMVSRHGTRGPGFFVALGATMLGRLLVAGAGGAVAVQAGERAIWGFVWGLAAGFVPLQAHEVLWFIRATAGSRGDGSGDVAGAGR